MAEKIVSPGVFTKEIDASFLPAAIGDIGAAIVGPTVKGPALVPTVVDSYSEFQTKFGDVFKSGSSYYQYLTSHTAKNYLENAGTLTVVRIMGADFNHASATISSSIDPAIVGGGTQHTASITIAGPILSSSFIGSHGSASFTPAGGSEVKFVFTGSVNRSGLLTDSATLIYVDSGSSTTISATNLKNAINVSSSLHGLPISASSATNIVNLTSSFAGAFGVSSRASGVTPARIFGGSQPTGKFIEIVGHSGSMTSKSMAGGGDFNSPATTGNTGVFTFPFTPFKIHTLSHGLILNNSASAGSGINSVLSDGTSNNIRWEIGNVNKKKGTFSLLIRKGDDTVKRKQILETWNNVNLDPNSNDYISKVVGDARWDIQGTTDDPYLQFTGDYANKSKYVRVEVLQQTTDYLDENGNIRTNADSASLPTFHSGSNSGSLNGSFGGGLDGTTTHPLSLYENISNTNVQGFNLATSAVKDQYTKALNLLANSDEYDFNLLLLPGIIRNFSNHTSLITKAVDICEGRGDAFVVVDTVGYSTTALGTVTDEAKAMDSNYAATYWPWIQIPDLQLGLNRWVPPSVAVAGVYSYNDKVGHPWFAPAGLNRGSVTTAVQAKRKLTQGNRDTLYEKNVNPIATFPGQGVTVWGQKTLQKKNSALDRVNVRRLLIKVKKFIASSSRFLVFEQNNAATRQRFLNIANPFLEQVQSQSGLNAFKVVMDETNNTPDVVDRNILYGQLFLQPTKTAEFIVLDFTIQATGAAFPE